MHSFNSVYFYYIIIYIFIIFLLLYSIYIYIIYFIYYIYIIFYYIIIYIIFYYIIIYIIYLLYYYLVKPNITNYEFSSACFTVSTHMTSLTFDLSHRIRKNYQKIEQKPFHGEKKVKKPSREEQRRIPLQDGRMNRHHVTRMKHHRVT